MPLLVERDSGCRPCLEGPPETVSIDVRGLGVRLARPAHLARAIDAVGLLRNEAAPEPPYWMHLWPGGLTLAKRLADEAQSKPLLVLELGCGLGLPALVAALRAARVIATDRVLAPLLMLGTSAAATGVTVRRVQMDWTAPAVDMQFDLCLAADVAYDHVAEPTLVDTLVRLVRRGGQAWLADSVNPLRTTLVERLGASGFAVRTTQQREMDEGRPVWVRLIEARRR